MGGFVLTGFKRRSAGNSHFLLWLLGGRVWEAACVFCAVQLGMCMMSLRAMMSWPLSEPTILHSYPNTIRDEQMQTALLLTFYLWGSSDEMPTPKLISASPDRDYTPPSSERRLFNPEWSAAPASVICAGPQTHQRPSTGSYLRSTCCRFEQDHAAESCTEDDRLQLEPLHALLKPAEVSDVSSALFSFPISI